MFYVVTTRFSAETFQQNAQFRAKYPTVKCIYGSSREMTKCIPPGSLVFVIEMNNTLNCVEGIGLIRNQTRLDKYIRIYESGNFNRYVYRGNYRMSREDIDANLLEALDEVLFKGRGHLKRGSGFLQIPKILLKHEKCVNLNVGEKIKSMFKTKFQNTSDVALE
jgi:hypothetical protein